MTIPRTDTPKPCRDCGRTDGTHEWVEQTCVLPHRRHSRPLLSGTFICEACAQRWDETLVDVVTLYADLAEVIPLGSVADDTADHTRTKRGESPAMFRLDAWVLAGHGRINPIVTDGKDEPPRITWLTGLPQIPVLLTNWAEAIWDAKGWGSDWPQTVSGAAAAIRANLPVLAALPDVDTFDDELRWIHRSLRQAHGISDPVPLFACLSVDCGGNVWQQPAGSPRCDRCGRRYDRLDIVRARGEELRERGRLRSGKTGNGHA